MAGTPPLSPSTFVEMEPPAPDVATPVWPPALRPPLSSHGPLHAPLHFTPTPASTTDFPGTHVRFASSPLAGSAPLQPFTWEQEPNGDSMQICTSSVASTFSSVTQQDLPGILSTPRTGVHQLTQVKGNWDTLTQHIQTHERSIGELTKELKTMSVHHESLISNLMDKFKYNQQEVLTQISDCKQQVKKEADQLTNSFKDVFSDELNQAKATYVSEVRFMIDQLQKEIQQDIKSYLVTHQRNHDQLSTELTQCTQTTNTLCAAVNSLQTELEKRFERQEKQLTDLKTRDYSPLPQTSPVSPTSPVTAPMLLITPDAPASPVTAPILLTAPAVKSDHLKITFPTFGRQSDDLDPLLYITRCQDFLALHPLADADILATSVLFSTVLPGTGGKLHDQL